MRLKWAEMEAAEAMIAKLVSDGVWYDAATAAPEEVEEVDEVPFRTILDNGLFWVQRPSEPC